MPPPSQWRVNELPIGMPRMLKVILWYYLVRLQGRGVEIEAGVGVARTRGKEPGVGIGVQVDQTASLPTQRRFV